MHWLVKIIGWCWLKVYVHCLILVWIVLLRIFIETDTRLKETSHFCFSNVSLFSYVKFSGKFRRQPVLSACHCTSKYFFYHPIKQQVSTKIVVPCCRREWSEYFTPSTTTIPTTITISISIIFQTSAIYIAVKPFVFLCNLWWCKYARGQTWHTSLTTTIWPHFPPHIFQLPS